MRFKPSSIYDQTRRYLRQLGGRHEFVPSYRRAPMTQAYAEARAMRTLPQLIVDVDDYVTVLEIAVESGTHMKELLERDRLSYRDAYEHLAADARSGSTLSDYLKAADDYVSKLEGLMRGEEATALELAGASQHYRETRSAAPH